MRLRRRRAVLRGVLGHLALRGHGRVEAGAVDAEALLGGDLLGELEREAVGVVQRERHVPDRVPSASPASSVVEDGEAGLSVWRKPLLLAAPRRR